MSIIGCRDQYISTSIWKCKNAGVWDVWVYYGICVCHIIHMETYNLQKYFVWWWFWFLLNWNSYTCIMNKPILTFSICVYWQGYLDNQACNENQMMPCHHFSVISMQRLYISLQSFKLYLHYANTWHTFQKIILRNNLCSNQSLEKYI